MARRQSRPKRWAAAVDDALAALDDLRAARDLMDNALERLRDVQGEYAEWSENLPENLRESALGEKLEAVTGIDLDLSVDLDELETAIGDAEAAELPRGFGKD